MRFTLAYVSTALLATVAMAAPAAQSNSEGEITVSSATTASPLDYDLKFQTFNWATKDGKTNVDRSFSLDLTEPASFQITDYKLGKLFRGFKLRQSFLHELAFLTRFFFF
jgi:hypothetical protein